MDDISDIKELVTQALARKRVLSKLRAELRSHVFVTIDEEETGAGGEGGLGKKTNNSAREAFVSTGDGQILADLVHEFLQWCNMEFTLRVFEPELGLGSDYRTRSELIRQLGLTGTLPEGPLLLSLLHSQQGNAPRNPQSVPASSAPKPTQPQQQAAPTAATSGGEESYSVEVESDVELEATDIADDDEDYASAVAGNAGPSATTRPSMQDTPDSPPSPEATASPGGLHLDPLKPRSLAPLAPIGARAPLAPLAPVGGAAKSLAPLSGAKKPMSDIKDELRREGLLTLPTDSFSASETSMDFPGSGEPTPAAGLPGPSRLSINSRAKLEDLGMSVDVGQSLDMRDPAVSPSDMSGDFDIEGEVDYQETAEWQ